MTQTWPWPSWPSPDLHLTFTRPGPGPELDNLTNVYMYIWSLHCSLPCITIVLHVLPNEFNHLFIRKLLKRQISQRLGSGPADADPIKTHPFFKHISWADVISRKLDPPFKPVLTSDVSPGHYPVASSHSSSFSGRRKSVRFQLHPPDPCGLSMWRLALRER